VYRSRAVFEISHSRFEDNDGRSVVAADAASLVRLERVLFTQNNPAGAVVLIDSLSSINISL
jgi:hypothetical protein